MKTAPQRVLCFGDSLIYGLRDSSTGERYPLEYRVHTLLQELLGSAYITIDEGLRSRTIAMDDPDKPDRNGFTYLRPCIESIEPNILILWLGTNNTKSRLEQTPQNMLEQFEQIHTWLLEKYPNTRIIIIPPPHIDTTHLNEKMASLFGIEAESKIIEYQKLLSNYCITNKLIYIQELESISADTVDGIHLSIESNQIVADAIANTINSLSNDL